MTLDDLEIADIERARATGRPVVVLVHGLWLLRGSWRPWRDHYEAQGYATVAPGWPGEPATVAEAREHPERLAGNGVRRVTEHVVAAIERLDAKPAVVGHSFGGMIAQQVAGHGLAAVTVAIDPAPFRGVLPLPASSLRSAFPVLRNPANARRAVTLTWDQFRYGWVNALDEAEGRALHEEHHVAAPGRPLFQAATANVNPRSELRVDTRRADRGPMLLISGEKDTTVPWALVNAAYRRQKRSSAVTEIVEMAGRGHSLTIDSGWREVADTALAFVRRFLPPGDPA